QVVLDDVLDDVPGLLVLPGRRDDTLVGKVRPATGMDPVLPASGGGVLEHRRFDGAGEDEIVALVPDFDGLALLKLQGRMVVPDGEGSRGALALAVVDAQGPGP